MASKPKMNIDFPALQEKLVGQFRGLDPKDPSMWPALPRFAALLAIVVVVPGRRGAVATGLLLAACALTRLWFPRTYWELVKEFDPTASWLVLARDVVLVALFAVLVVRVRAREPEPG